MWIQGLWNKSSPARELQGRKLNGPKVRLGDSHTDGIYIKLGGNGGAGGHGGSAVLVAGGTVRALDRGVIASAFGGNGGYGGNAFSNDKLDEVDGGQGATRRAVVGSLHLAA